VGDSGSDKAPNHFEFNSVHFFPSGYLAIPNPLFFLKLHFFMQRIFFMNMDVALTPEVLVTIGENTRRRILYD
jgi:hypothetical protein